METGFKDSDSTVWRIRIGSVLATKAQKVANPIASSAIRTELRCSSDRLLLLRGIKTIDAIIILYLYTIINLLILKY